MSVEYTAIFLLGAWVGGAVIWFILIALRALFTSQRQPFDPENPIGRFK